MSADATFTASECETALLISTLCGVIMFNHVNHKQVMETCRQAMKAEKGLAASALIEQIGNHQGG